MALHEGPWSPGLHPAYGLRPGMDRATVVDRLGPPTRSMAGQDMVAKFDSVASISGTPWAGDGEWWLYTDVAPGLELHVVITSGVLESIKIISATGKVDVTKGGIHASAPTDAVAALSAIVADLPPVDQGRLQSDSDALRETWRGPTEVGPPADIMAILRQDLEEDAKQPHHDRIGLYPTLDQFCVQVVSIYSPPEGASHGIAYRMWRTTDGSLVTLRSSVRKTAHAQAGRKRVEAALIFHTGDRPESAEVLDLLRVFEQVADVDLTGVRITPIGVSDASQLTNDLAMAGIVRLQSEGSVRPGALDRTIYHNFSKAGRSCLVAVVLAPEQGIGRTAAPPVISDQEQVTEAGTVSFRLRHKTAANQRSATTGTAIAEKFKVISVTVDRPSEDSVLRPLRCGGCDSDILVRIHSANSVRIERRKAWRTSLVSLAIFLVLAPSTIVLAISTAGNLCVNAIPVCATIAIGLFTAATIAGGVYGRFFPAAVAPTPMNTSEIWSAHDVLPPENPGRTQVTRQGGDALR